MCRLPKALIGAQVQQVLGVLDNLSDMLLICTENNKTFWEPVRKQANVLFRIMHLQENGMKGKLL